MGTSYTIFNHTKKEYIFSHRFKGGYKYWENIFGDISKVLVWLIANDWRGDKIEMLSEHDINSDEYETEYKDVSYVSAKRFNEEYREEKIKTDENEKDE